MPEVFSIFLSTKALFYWLGSWSFMCTIFDFLFGFSFFFSLCPEFVHFFCIIIPMIICQVFRSGDAITIGCLVV